MNELPHILERHRAAPDWDRMTDAEVVALRLEVMERYVHGPEREGFDPWARPDRDELAAVIQANTHPFVLRRHQGV